MCFGIPSPRLTLNSPLQLNGPLPYMYLLVKRHHKIICTQCHSLQCCLRRLSGMRLHSLHMYVYSLKLGSIWRDNQFLNLSSCSRDDTLLNNMAQLIESSLVQSRYWNRRALDELDPPDCFIISPELQHQNKQQFVFVDHVANTELFD